MGPLGSLGLGSCEQGSFSSVFGGCEKAIQSYAQERSLSWAFIAGLHTVEFLRRYGIVDGANACDHIRGGASSFSSCC